ncbi:ABC transporter substrate-binding protein [Desulfonema magnum]|uniref:Leucine binding domain-containing protein n=1 Tax=Desulfonema magnum TaxID=45655 RepID=A0A975BM69_9BACT|nr:ABC transporter substrate-binding protein [Desulfonema magnum]QTA87797.1 Leucine binding domain-containing protein [Desulfonema magnum]
MRNTLLILLIIFINIVIYLLFLLPASPLKKDIIYIAVAGPMEAPGGQAMRKGAELYKDKINSQGGIDGREIELLFFDDKGDPEISEKIASEIADQNKALLVLGHYRSNTSAVAGKIYKRNGIPVLTASATEESVTLGNEWYFRTVSNNAMEAKFVANYIKAALKKQSASIVYSNDTYGISLFRNFKQTISELGMKIEQKWEWNRDDKSDDQLKKIVNELKATDDPTVLFLATHSAEGVKIITALKNEGKSCSVIGSYAFARSFLIEMEKYPDKESQLGYCSEGIRFVSPFMTAIGGEETYIFKQDFLEKYNEAPSEISACYYDAIKVAVEAVKKAGIQGKGYIREDRRRIRDVLASFYSEDNAVRGITGHIYFDENGDVRKHYAVGIWLRHKPVPAFLQYQQSDIGRTDNLLKKILHGETILLNGISMNNIRLVYAGIDNLRVSNLDTKHSECTLEFDLGFRYSGYFDDTTIEFENSVSPVRLGKPLKEERTKNITRRVYRVKADFKYDFDFHTYPFDQHMMPIRFRHTDQTKDRLIYVPDVLSLPESVSSSVGEWKISEISFYQDITAKDSNLGNPKFFGLSNVISYSRFNAEIHIKRKNLAAFIFSKFFPVIAMLLILCLPYFIRPERLRNYALIFMSVLIINTVCYLRWLSALSVEYLTILDYAFFTVYVLLIISAFMSVFIYRPHDKKRQKKVGAEAAH